MVVGGSHEGVDEVNRDEQPGGGVGQNPPMSTSLLTFFLH